MSQECHESPFLAKTFPMVPKMPLADIQAMKHPSGLAHPCKELSNGTKNAIGGHKH